MELKELQCLNCKKEVSLDKAHVWHWMDNHFIFCAEADSAIKAVRCPHCNTVYPAYQFAKMLKMEVECKANAFSNSFEIEAE